MTVSSSDSKPKAGISGKAAGAHKLEDRPKGNMMNELFMKPEEVEKILSKKKGLALVLGVASMLIMAILFLGIAVDSIMATRALMKTDLDIRTYRAQVTKWNLLDVGKVAILFLFFGYVLVIMESCFVSAKMFRLFKEDNFRMIFNSSILDGLAVVLILYFTITRYKENLAALGLSAKNFVRNVFYGLVGYVAATPVLIAVLIIILIIINITKYVPEQQPVVELFLKEKNTAFLVFTSLFAAVMGPIIEELFFRGFMYNAFKKYTGIFWATLITAVIFAALHTNLVGFLPIMVLGILLAYLYEKTGTLVSSMTVHIIHNLSMVFFVFLVKQLKP